MSIFYELFNLWRPVSVKPKPGKCYLIIVTREREGTVRCYYEVEYYSESWGFQTDQRTRGGYFKSEVLAWKKISRPPKKYWPDTEVNRY